MAALIPLKTTTKAIDLFNSVQSIITKLNLKYANMSSVATDGAPSMIGKNKGLIQLIKNECSLNLKCKSLHCIIHQENLVAKKVQDFDEIINTITKIINFIKGKALNRRHFLNEQRSRKEKVLELIYHCEVRWLSRGNMLKRFYELKDDILLFLQDKPEISYTFIDVYWCKEYACLVDITMH